MCITFTRQRTPPMVREKSTDRRSVNCVHASGAMTSRARSTRALPASGSPTVFNAPLTRIAAGNPGSKCRSLAPWRLAAKIKESNAIFAPYDVFVLIHQNRENVSKIFTNPPPYRAVAQIYNLLYRRIAFGNAPRHLMPLDAARPSGLQIRDTAECNSALRCLPTSTREL